MRGAAAAVGMMIAVGALTVRPAEACSVCQAGDPVFSGGAAGPRGLGSASLYLEYQGYRKESALLADEVGAEPEEGNEVNRGRQLNTLLTLGVSDRLSLSAQLPFRSNRIRERPDEAERSTSSLVGFGDLALSADYTVWRNRDILPNAWLALRLYGKAPTGADARSVDGRIDPHLQLGTGSWDYGAGFGAGRRLEWGSLYASALYRVNNQGANRYEYGDVLLANVAIEAPVGSLTGRATAESTTVGMEINYRYARRDNFGGSLYGDSGGSILYATPSFRIRLPGLTRAEEWSPSLRFSVQLPFGDGGLNGEQHEGMVWGIGLVMPLR